jgi:hypothetical protein
MIRAFLDIPLHTVKFHRKYPKPNIFFETKREPRVQSIFVLNQHRYSIPELVGYLIRIYPQDTLIFLDFSDWIKFHGEKNSHFARYPGKGHANHNSNINNNSSHFQTTWFRFSWSRSDPGKFQTIEDRPNFYSLVHKSISLYYRSYFELKVERGEQGPWIPENWYFKGSWAQYCRNLLLSCMMCHSTC